MSATNHSEISVTDESRPQESVGAPATKTATEKRPSPISLNKLVVALSIYAALRILVFAAAFPLFNNVDERVHLMSIQMYAQGHLPAKELPQMDPDLAKDYLRYWSPEYGRSQEDLERNGIKGSTLSTFGCRQESGIFPGNLRAEARGMVAQSQL